MVDVDVTHIRRSAALAAWLNSSIPAELRLLPQIWEMEVIGFK